jgi:hypothetical protein
VPGLIVGTGIKAERVKAKIILVVEHRSGQPWTYFCQYPVLQK